MPAPPTGSGAASAEAQGDNTPPERSEPGAPVRPFDTAPMAAAMPGDALSTEALSPDASAPIAASTPSEPEPPDVTCSGCVELLVPVTGGQQVSFQFEFPAPGEAFDGGIIEWRVQVPEANADPAFFIIPYVQNGAALLYAGVYGNAPPLSTDNFPPGQWVDIAISVPAAPALPPFDGSTEFDGRVVERVGITLGASAEFTGAGTIRLLLDSVTFSGVPSVANVTFATSVEGFVLNQFLVPEGTSEPIHHP
jgi:hypothetical protein